MVEGKVVTYIEATEADVAAVEALCASVLGTTADEMSPATRKLREAVRAFVAARAEPSFTRRELREATGLGDSQLKVHLARLADLEHVVAERAGRYTTYELAAAPSEDASLRGHRPGPEAHRPGLDGHRPAIGRFSGKDEKLPPGSEDGPSPSHRPVTGRSSTEGEQPPSTREDVLPTPHRPVLLPLRGTGGTDGGVVGVGTGAG
jgi:DNA-binding transcriptional ArsR family regulator